MRIENDYLVLNDEQLKEKRMTPRLFTAILGLNPQIKRGDAFLELFGLINYVENKNGLKLNKIAKAISLSVNARTNKCTFCEDEDSLSHISNFGGALDIYINDTKTLICCIGKPMSEYKNNFESTTEELMQAYYLAYLSNMDLVNLEYIFFDNQTQEEIKKDESPTSLKNIKRYVENHITPVTDMEIVFKSVIKQKLRFIKSKKIPLNDLSERWKNLK